MKYKTGDQARVRKNARNYTFFNQEGGMDEYLGKIVTIKRVRSYYYVIEEDIGRWNWHEEMLEDIKGYAYHDRLDPIEDDPKQKTKPKPWKCANCDFQFPKKPIGCPGCIFGKVIFNPDYKFDFPCIVCDAGSMEDACGLCKGTKWDKSECPFGNYTHNPNMEVEIPKIINTKVDGVPVGKWDRCSLSGPGGCVHWRSDKNKAGGENSIGFCCAVSGLGNPIFKQYVQCPCPDLRKAPEDSVAEKAWHRYRTGASFTPTPEDKRLFMKVLIEAGYEDN